MRLEGEIVVRLVASGRKVRGVEARASRPAVAGRLLVGRPADEAPGLVESIFSICGRSQAIAAMAALESARGQSQRAAVRRARDRRIAAETLQEYAWRLLMDQPRLLGREPHVEALAGGRRAIAPFLGANDDAPGEAAVKVLEAWVRETIFGIGPAEFASLGSAGDLLAWARAGATPVARDSAAWLAEEPSMGGSDVPLLPAGDDGWIVQELAAAMAADARFERAPARDGAPCETGALARLQGHPLVRDAVARWGRGVASRLAARLVESASLCLALRGESTPRHGAAPLGGSTAMAWVETARGLLVHRAELDGERVAGWRIVAPTEWNFHPEGAFARGAIGLEADGDEALRAKAMRLAASLDPCVSLRCEVGHA